MKKIFGAIASGLFAGVSVATAQADEMTAWRLFVSDHSEPKVTAVDAVKREVIDTFQVKAPAALYRSSSGAAVFAVQRDGNVVSTISTGIAFDDHGDHRDLDVEAPRLTGAEIAGDGRMIVNGVLR